VRLDVPVGRNDEVTRLGDTLNAMIDALEQALDWERRFVNDASHELRTPLTLLKTRVQLAQRRKRTVPEHEAVLTEVETDIGRLAQLAGQLLQVGTRTAESASISSDLAAAVIEEVERRRPLSGALDLELQLRTTPPVPVALDPTQLAQLLGNLLDNAAVHGRPPVTIVVDALNGVGCLQVIDLGEGMDRELLPTATRRFARAPQAQSRPGFGLGLFLVHDIVNHAGGELRLCCAGAHERFGRRHQTPCQHGEAMTVTVFLPMVADGQRPAAPATNVLSEQPSDGNQGI
jgi:signal transduction histidine kinase